MSSVILTTTYLLIIAIVSICIAIVSLITREIKVLPLVNFATMMFVVIASLFLGAEFVEVLIFVAVHLIIYFINIFVRHKEDL